MTYIKQTFIYMFKAMRVLFFVCLPAAVALGIFTKPMASLSYLVDYSHLSVNGFTDILWLVFNKYDLKYVYPLIIIFACLLFSVSLALSVIEKHFRTGKLISVSPFKQINVYLLPVLAAFAILAVILFLYCMIQCGILTLLHFIISGKGVPSAVNMVLAAILSVGLFVLVVFVSCTIMYWAPMMVIYGFSFRDAAASSLRIADKKTGSILFGLLVPFLIAAVLESLFSLITIKYVRIALAVIEYEFVITYVVSFIMVTMFSLTGMERRDKKKKIGEYGVGV